MSLPLVEDSSGGCCWHTQGQTQGSTLQQRTKKTLTIVPFGNTCEIDEISPEVEAGEVAGLKCLQPRWDTYLLSQHLKNHLEINIHYLLPLFTSQVKTLITEQRSIHQDLIKFIPSAHSIKANLTFIHTISTKLLYHMHLT
jgi:hypothetical protein